MLDIKIGRKIVCDNNKKYILGYAKYPYKYTLYDYETFEKVNEVKEHYIEDALKLNYSICVGRNGKKLEYVSIIDIEKSQEELRDDVILEDLRFINTSTERQNEIMEEIRKIRSKVGR